MPTKHGVRRSNRLGCASFLLLIVMWKVNTSNSGKQAEYRDYLGSDVEFLKRDLPEPDADFLTIIRYKASQFDDVLVDDVSLEVEGADSFGTNIRWDLAQLESCIGRPAQFICLLGIHRPLQKTIEIFRGFTNGKIVSPQGESFGFNPYFLPDNSTKTFGEEIPRLLNPRYQAIQLLLKSQPWKKEAPLKDWGGLFQNQNSSKT